MLHGGCYEELTPSDDGILRSEFFPGLWLDTASLLRDDMRRVLAVLDEGMEMEAHGEFVAKLANYSP